MNLRRTTNGLLLLITFATIGILLVMIPGWIVDQAATVRAIGPGWLVYVYFTVVGVGSLLFLASTGYVVWKLGARTRVKQQQRKRRDRDPSQLSRSEREAELEENLAAAAELRRSWKTADELLEEVEPLQKKIEEKRVSQKLEIVAFGAISSGKSSLLNALAGADFFQMDPKGGTTIQRNELPWPGADRVLLVDTPGLGEIDGATRGSLASEAAKDADVVLLVLDGPLREWEFELLTKLGEMEKRIIVCLNKEDWYDRHERQRLLSQIELQIQACVRPEDIVAVRSRVTKRPRIRVLSDGSQIEEEVEVPLDISPLAERLLAIVRREGQDLLMANLLLQSRGLVEEARRRVQDALDARAQEVVNRYMWGAGGAAALNPFPLVDLVAGCAISTKMVVDLGHIYKQDIDLQAALKLLSQLGKNLISILGLNAAAPAVAAAVGSLLKAVPGAGTIAGQVLQGIVQALITRWIGFVFIAYFKNEMQQPEGGLTALARREWERLTTIDELRRLVGSARKQWRDGGSPKNPLTSEDRLGIP
jgi:GTPase SAR1 family protein